MIRRSKDLCADAAAVGAGCALGGVARFASYEAFASMNVRARPWTTLGVNVAGSFLLGAMAASTSAALTPRRRLLFGSGFCGGFTTMSTFSVEFAQMVQASEAVRATAYFTLTNVGSVGAAVSGMHFAKRFIK